MGFQIVAIAIAIYTASLLAFLSLSDRLTSVIKVNQNQAHSSALSSYIEAYKSRVRVTMTTNNLSSSEFLAGLRCQLENQCSDYVLFGHPPTAPSWATSFVQSTLLNATTPPVLAQITAVSPSSASTQKLKFKITSASKDVTMSEKEVELRLGLNTVFKNAMTGNSFKCLFCHAMIMGDIASYRPDGILNSMSTKIHGSFLVGGTIPEDQSWEYIAKIVNPTNPVMVTDDYPDDSSDKYVNYSLGRPSLPAVSSDEFRVLNTMYDWTEFADSLYVHGLKENYLGASLPWNMVREKMILPKFDPVMMKDFASGKVSGDMIKAPLNQKLTGGNFYQNTVSRTYDGNLILNGRTNPIEIKGPVFVSGDIIIFGKVSGMGTLYSGRNIYIADNLVYNNPPPHFNGSRASNVKMSLVSQNGANLAHEMQSYDRLALFATNNIILGDPFNTLNSYNDADMIFINSTNLIDYAQSRELAYDPANGEMYDREYVGEDRVCYLKPWEDSTSCRYKTGEYPDKTSDVIVTPILNTQRIPASTAFATDHEYYLNEYRPMIPDDNYKINFIPNNFKNGTITPWIDKDNYFRLTVDKNSSSYLNTVTKDSFGRRGRYFHGILPLPAANIFRADAIDATAILKSLEDNYGFKTELASLPATQGDTVSHTALGRLNEFLDKCRQAAIGVAPNDPLYPITGLLNTTRDSRNSITNRVVMTLNGAPEPIENPQPFYVTGIECDFYYWPDSQFPNGTKGEVQNKITFVSNPNDGTGHIDWGYDNRVTICNSWETNPGYTLGSIRPPCTTLADGSPLPSVGASDVDQFMNSAAVKLSITLSYEANLYQIDIKTRIYDEKKIHYRNKLEKIQAFLFANQFISYLYSNNIDRQLRIHGGVVAKDFLGRYLNVSGPERAFSGLNPYVDPIFKNQAVSTRMDHTFFPALWVISDPRFQYTTDLINRDFLNVISVR